jgi:hypothetical protein
VTKLGEAAELGAAKQARARAASSAAQAMAERGGVAGKAADAQGLAAVFERRSSTVSVPCAGSCVYCSSKAPLYLIVCLARWVVGIVAIAPLTLDGSAVTVESVSNRV